MVSEASIQRTASRLALMAVAMFGFGYLLVPLYDVFCEVTGFNGKTGEIAYEQISVDDIDMERDVVIEFDTNTRALPWDFKAVEQKISVHPGELSEAKFTVVNNSNKAIIGRAIPSVAPTQASVFFNKTDCFCFDEQRLEAGETREMIVRFVVGTNLPKRFGSLVLSYTFFEVPGSQEKVVGLPLPERQQEI